MRSPVARDGTILGLRGEVFIDLGAYVRTNGLIAPRTLAQFFSGPYRVPNMRITATALLTNKTPAGTYRAPGRYAGLRNVRTVYPRMSAGPRLATKPTTSSCGSLLCARFVQLDRVGD